MSVAGSVGRRLTMASTVRRLTMASTVRRLTMASTVRRLQGLDIHPSARPRHWDVTSRRFSSGSSPEQSEKYQKLLVNISAGLGCLSTLATMLASVGFFVINTVNDGVDKKFLQEQEATSAKLDAEKVHREGFQILATETHLNSVRDFDEIVAELRAQFNSLTLRCIEGQALKALYRTKILKAQEVLERKGVTSSAEVHVQLLPKINKLQAQINFLTEELAHLKLIAQESATAAQEKNMKNDSTPPSLETASDLKGCSATQNGSPPIQHVEAATSVQKGLSAAETGQNMKSDDPSSGAKGTTSQGGGGSASV